MNTNLLIQSFFKDIEVKFLGVLLMTYVGMQIIFGLDTNVLYSNLVNILLLGVYLVISIYRKHRGIYFGTASTFFILFALTCIISAGWASDPSKSIGWFRSLIIITINIVLFYDIVKRYDLHKFILYGFVIGSVFNHLIALEFITFSNPNQGRIRFIGTVGNPNILSTIILLGLVSSGILLNYTKSNLIKLFHTTNILLCLYVVFLTMSRKGIAIAAILIVIFLIKNISSIKGVIALVIIGIFTTTYIGNALQDEEKAFLIYSNLERIEQGMGVFDGKQSNTSGALRLKYVKLGKQLFLQSPIYGHGFNNFSHFSGFHYSHNNYIEILTGMGLIGFILYYFIHFKLLGRILKAPSFNLKLLLFGALLVILVGDIGTVSYLKKHTMTMLVFLDCYTRKYI